MKLKYIPIILLIIPSNIYANSITCPTTAYQNEEIDCNITIENISGISANYKLDDMITYLDLSLDSSWKTYYKDKIGFAIGNLTNQSTLTSTLNLKISSSAVINKEYKIIINNIETTDNNYNLTTQSNLETTIKVVSNSSYLKSLNVDGIKLNETFNKDTKTYTATTTKNSIDISALAENLEAKIVGDIGTHYLNYGANSFTIKVVNQDGKEMEYQLIITRTNESNKKNTSSTKEDIPTLEEIKISDEEIKLEKDKYLYNIEVDYGIEDISIDAIATDSKNKVIIDKPEKLKVGENKITITVTAEDGTITTYIVMVDRKNIDGISESKNLEEQKENINTKDNSKVVKKGNKKNKVLIYFATAILCILLILIATKQAINLKNFIRKNKE